ncbi:SemiSWEET transporter [Rhodocytophaga rosea]|uniref:SemiSWEET transporter n=1 Tax=Rhodocytophaga rosea TaxID=2704465 RepID=UPI0018D91735|nr:SemiSWEET transporter [Rhodocytophaga rosea]
MFSIFSIETVGLIAGALTTVSFVPQVIKTWRSRSAKDLSLSMFTLFCAGLILWLIYGIALSSLAIIIANAFTLVLAICLLVFKFTFKN